MTVSEFSSDESLESIGAYVDGELPASEVDAVESLLESNPALRELAQEFRQMDELTRVGDPPPISGAEWSSTLTAVRKSVATESESRSDATSDRSSFGWKPWLLAAALVVGAYLAPQLLDTGGQNHTVTPTPPPAPEGNPDQPSPIDVDPEEKTAGQPDERIGDLPVED
ncbi:MAG: hypothetical protein AAF517_22555 [Planctomycetota bacterium]